MGYQSVSGWAKIERGQRELTYEILQKANGILKLDERYYFGKLSYDEAKDNNSGKIESIIKRLDQLRPPSREDPVLDRVANNAALYDLVKEIQYLEGGILKSFKEMAFAYLRGRQDEKEKTEERGAAKQAQGA